MTRAVAYVPPKLHAAFQVWLAQQRERSAHAPKSYSEWTRRTMLRCLKNKFP